MTVDTANLPEFKDPPVVEVALSIKFKPLNLTTAHLGLLWERFRGDFPSAEDQVPLDLPHEIERERVPTQLVVTLPGQLRAFSSPRVRSWFVSATGTQLLQVQHDFFAHNWRRNDTEESYPRFANVKRAFEQELRVFTEFLAEHKLGSLEPTQCEVTYINHIFAGRTWQTHDEVHKVFRFWSNPTNAFLPALDDGRFLVRYVIPDDKGAFCGRLHVSSQPGFAQVGGEEKRLLATTLTARGRPLGDGVAGALAFLDVGHVWIVRGFADLTTEGMQQEWGRTR